MPDISDRVSVSASSKGGEAVAKSHRSSRRTLSIASEDSTSHFSHVGRRGDTLKKDDEWNAIIKFNTLLHYEE